MGNTVFVNINGPSYYPVAEVKLCPLLLDAKKSMTFARRGRSKFAIKDGKYTTLSRRILLFPILLASFLLSCGGEKTAAAPQKPAEEGLAIPADRFVDDAARYLAGLSAKPGSKLADLHELPSYKHHVEDFDFKFSVFEQGRRAAMQKFQQTELSATQVTGSTLLYAFGGPDVLTAHTFFPKNKTYILMGLEPAGGLPSEEYLRSKLKSDYLPKIRGSMNSLLDKSFFITLLMDQMYRGQITDGLMPIMLVQLVRTKHTVLGYLPVTLNENGKWMARNPELKGTDGMIIEAQKESGDKLRIIYISANLQDDKLAANKPLLTFLASLKPTVAYFKAASYLPHHKDFKLIRDTILSLSSAVLEDDSGIPYKYFDKEEWSFTLFGKYDRPYGSFRNMVQPTLKADFEGPNVKPLDFPIGYGFKRQPSDLILAIKKPAAPVAAKP